jgi:hypothetical protein
MPSRGIPRKDAFGGLESIQTFEIAPWLPHRFILQATMNIQLPDFVQDHSAQLRGEK